MPDLFSSHTLTFNVPDNDGYYEDNGTFVSGSTTPQDIVGSLQPFDKKKERIVLPEGVRAIDTKIFYTQTEIKTSDNLDDQFPYTTTVEGHLYEVFIVEPWIGFGLPDLEHYKCFLRRVDESAL